VFRGYSSAIWGGPLEGILRMAGGISPTWSPTKLGMDLTFIFDKVYGVKKRISRPYFQNSIP
jgi:hypothetical protein